MEPEPVVELPAADAPTPEAAIGWAVGWMVAAGRLPPDLQAEATAAVVRREHLGSTMVAAGTAIPHSRVRGLGAVTSAVFTSADGVPWPAPPQRPELTAPVTRMYLLLSPHDKPGEHLRALERIMTRLREAGGL